MTLQQLLNRIDGLKAKLDGAQPLSAGELSQLREYYKIGLTYTSNALEGNSLTEMETKVVIEDGLTVGGKPLRDHLEAAGHAEAYDQMVRLAQGKTITEEDITDVASPLLPSPGCGAGRPLSQSTSLDFRQPIRSARAR